MPSFTSRLFPIWGLPVILLLISLLLVSLGSAPSHAQDDVYVAFNNVSVLPMEGGGILDHQTVIIKNDRIHAISDAQSADIPEAAKTIDGTGRFLMPGLTEMHGHIPPLSRGEDAVNDTLFLYLSNGVTTVRGMLGSPNQLQLRDDALSGKRLSPTLYLAGPSFNGNSVTSPAQAEALVMQHVNEGWDLLKVHPGLTLDEYNAMAAKAKAEGIGFAGHVPAEVGLLRALSVGQDTLDHLDGYIALADGFDKTVSDAVLRDLAQRTKAANVAVVPTQALWATLIGVGDLDTLSQFEELKYISPATVENWKRRIGFLTQGNPDIHQDNRQRLLKILQEEGVEILFGTDAPQLFSVPGFSIHREIQMMKEAGLSSNDILESATRNIGRYYQNKDAFGTVTPNARADLILLNTNPLIDMDTLKRPVGVMVRGQWLSRAVIDAELDAIAERVAP